MYQHLRGLAVLAALVSLGMLHPSLVSAEQIPPELERAGYVDFHREQALKMRTDVSIVQTFTTLTVVSASNPKPLTHEQASAILETIATEEVSMNMGRTLRHSVERNASDDMDKLAIVSPEIRNALSDYVLINMNHAVYRHCRKKLEAHPAFRNADNAPFGESTSVGMRRRYRRTADSATVTPAHFKARLFGLHFVWR
ncbi:hypothetical protein CXG81DRAFT_17959 [Caulochytrium protostelioides]|uniref:Uncharacterized protein n=1 Tax=Caulochytrium protostelioides TaxID=1555241 RepID=A0A4P9XAH6_9FUNG|nr:hypothetical protein CXG81DRAFT_17959 [Caulochytrium protostelioides]|eukprot:RKP02364.1 hypothetical protein CXG81DRAFT_17959 [Caulochytrium protostelioides]